MWVVVGILRAKPTVLGMALIATFIVGQWLLVSWAFLSGQESAGDLFRSHWPVYLVPLSYLVGGHLYVLTPLVHGWRQGHWEDANGR